jgi:hypothetical protein
VKAHGGREGMLVAVRNRLTRAAHHLACLARLGLVLGIGLGVGGVTAQSAVADTPFQRGDVFIVASDGVREYSPSGELRWTVPGTTGARVLCFDRDGRHLILPGVGLFDSSGNMLPSTWTAVTNADRCVADGTGHVYVSSRTDGYAITKYELDGAPVQRFDVIEEELHSLAIDVAPDECTMYYGSWGISTGVISRLNVCNNTRELPFAPDGFVDDLRVLPDWRVVKTDDAAAALYSPAGQGIRSYNPPGPNGDSFRTVGLDPDGTSVWVCCTWTSPSSLLRIFRFDIESGEVLADWGIGDAGSTTMTVYGPPLVGHANVEDSVVSSRAGTATAFRTTARSSGDVTQLHLYVDSSSTASQAVVGIYSDRRGHPSRRLTQATITNLRSGSWNYATVPSKTLAAGERYWIAVLAPRGGGTISLRGAEEGGRAETSAQHNLVALHLRWTSDRVSSSVSASAYGS